MKKVKFKCIILLLFPAIMQQSLGACPTLVPGTFFTGLKPLSYPLLEGNPSPIEHDTTKIPSIVRLEACMDVLNEKCKK